MARPLPSSEAAQLNDMQVTRNETFQSVGNTPRGSHNSSPAWSLTGPQPSQPSESKRRRPATAPRERWVTSTPDEEAELSRQQSKPPWVPSLNLQESRMMSEEPSTRTSSRQQYPTTRAASARPYSARLNNYRSNDAATIRTWHGDRPPRPDTARTFTEPPMMWSRQERKAVISRALSRAPLVKAVSKNPARAIEIVEKADSTGNWRHIDKYKEYESRSRPPVIKSIIQNRIFELRERVQVLAQDPKYCGERKVMSFHQHISVAKSHAAPQADVTSAEWVRRRALFALRTEKNRKQLEEDKERHAEHHLAWTRRDRARNEREHIALAQNHEISQQFMLGMVTAACATTHLQLILERDRSRRNKAVLYVILQKSSEFPTRLQFAASRIQKFIKTRVLQRSILIASKRISIMRLRRTFRPHLIAWKQHYVQRATDRVLTFLQDCATAAAIKIQFSRFLARVVQIQRFVRSCLTKTRARLELLALQWNKCENESLHILYQKRTRAIRKHKTELTIAMASSKVKRIHHFPNDMIRVQAMRAIEVSRTNYVKGLLPAQLETVQMVHPQVKAKLLHGALRRMRRRLRQGCTKYEKDYMRWKENTRTARAMQDTIDMLSPGPMAAVQNMSFDIPNMEMRKLSRNVPPPLCPLFTPFLSKKELKKLIARGRQLTKETIFETDGGDSSSEFDEVPDLPSAIERPRRAKPTDKAHIPTLPPTLIIDSAPRPPPPRAWTPSSPVASLQFH